jgi:acid stress-induced BolA-like protein IbaG/YrbA
MDIKEKIKQVLLSLDIVDPEVIFLDEYGYRVVAVVISSSFQGMPDGDRQHMVWGKLLDELTEREQGWVEFVFTKAPSEIDRSKLGVNMPVSEIKP